MTENTRQEQSLPAPSGVELIAAERQRQINAEGWTPEHDDGHADQSLAWAAACYAAPERIYVADEVAVGYQFADPWPWDDSDDKRKSPGSNYPNIMFTREGRIRLLVKAGALIAAEIDRLQRNA